MSDFVSQAGPLRELVERELAKLFTPGGRLADGDVPPGLAEPMRYALLGGGKRLRPVLCLAVCQTVCGDPEPALPAALAVEVLHNYTLVHDDLPCLDDDLVRRGRPTVHAKFGYAQALLVGDALQAAAFQLALAPSPWSAAVARVLARAAGPAGVVGGQWADVTGAPPYDEAHVAYVHAHKTGDLIACACETGAVAGAAARGGSVDSSPDRLVAAARDLGRALGLAFQIVDDLLDADAPGKAGELSILRVCTPAEARARARAATQRALVSLDALAAAGSASPAAASAVRLLRSLAEDQLARTV